MPASASSGLPNRTRYSVRLSARASRIAQRVASVAVLGQVAEAIRRVAEVARPALAVAIENIANQEVITPALA